MIAGEPTGDESVPPAVRALADGRPVRAVWHNEVGGLTFQLGRGPDRRFVKWAPDGSGPDLSREADRLRWASRYTPVPGVWAGGRGDGGHWLLTAGLPGDSAVSARGKRDPRAAVTAIGHGLRRLHDALPVADCPYSWSVSDRRAVIDRMHIADQLDPTRWNGDHAGLDVSSALAELAEPPPVERLVVCHGDACAPNTLLDHTGGWSGHVDFGALGVADRW